MTNEQMRVEFEAHFGPPPDSCGWSGDGYHATSYGAWSAHSYADKFEGWKAACNSRAAKDAGARQLAGDEIADLVPDDAVVLTEDGQPVGVKLTYQQVRKLVENAFAAKDVSAGDVTPRLTRNHDGDLLLAVGETTTLVAKVGTPLWEAIVSAATPPAPAAPVSGAVREALHALAQRIRQHAETHVDCATGQDQLNAIADEVGALAATQQAEPSAAGPNVESVYETIIQWDEGGGKRSRRELAHRIAALYAAEPVAAYPEKCPITRRPFFMVIEHPELGRVPTYGGPYDSYTIPVMQGDPAEPMHERELEVHRYDHDFGGWVDDETIPLRVIHDYVLFELTPDTTPTPAAAPATPSAAEPSDQDEALLRRCLGFFQNIEFEISGPGADEAASEILGALLKRLHREGGE